ncbi:MAG TPA: hypothetical protein VK147_08365, partial [Candidatus Didemnitutus sp.]|nr:hypothetical protein [Candidatus Didemnitutus sp.]
MDHRNSVALRYTSLTYHDVWPGIDMRSYTTSTGVKYDFIVHPGASPSQIAFVYKGGSLPWLTESGSLNLATPLGTIGERAPLTYQYVDGESTNTIIASRFKLDGYSIRFAIAEYDSSRPLIIDPQRVWATYYGGVPAGSGYRTSFGARTAIDSLGYAYFSGTTQAYNMPSSAGVLQKKHKAMLDGYVAKFDEFGKFIWHTYYGGSANDQIIDITIAPDNSVWVCGTTSSDDLPYLGAGSGPYGDADSNEVNEATVLKLTPDGAWADSWQIYGTQVDYAVSIAVSKDRVAVAGFTRSPKVGSHFGYPYTKNLETWSFGTQYDMFLCVTKPQSNNPARWVHEYVTFYGSEGNDLATKVAIDQRGNYLISGFSNSQGNITTDGSTPQGNDDALLVKFSNTMVRLWATRFGTNEIDQINDVAIDSKNNIIAGGYTEGLTFPVFNAFLSTRSGLFTNRQPEGFIRKWDELGTLLFSTYYGGDSGDAVNAVTVDMSDRIWLVGKTLYSTTIPVTPDAFQKVPQPKTGFDGFIGQLSADGQTVLFGSYYGAKSHYLIPPEVADYPNLDPGVDELTDIAVQKNAYISLSTQARSYRMPWTDGAFQDSFAVRTDTVRDNAFFTYVTTCPDSTIT